jgi:hypothetical protein
VIVRERDGRLILVRQSDHDDQCGRMAAYLDAGLFSDAACHRALTQAAFLHDNGWDAWEEVPRLQADTQRPLLFTRLDVGEWCALYSDGIAVAAEAGPLTGLLASMHGLGLRRRFLGILGDTSWRTPPEGEDPEVERFCQEQELLQAELIDRLRASPHSADVVAGSVLPDPGATGGPTPLTYGPTLIRLYKLLEFLDALSLRLAWRGLSEEPLGPVPDPDPGRPDRTLTVRKVDEYTLALSPYPFSHSPLAVPLPARVLTDRAFGSDEEFRDAFNATEVSLLPFTLAAL